MDPPTPAPAALKALPKINRQRRPRVPCAKARQQQVAAAAAALPLGTYPATLSSIGGQDMRVTLSAPDDGETCPLTLSPIAEDALDFLQGRTFSALMPGHKRLTLPCGHAFGALSIVYHFARQNMLCPCCRAGFKHRVSFDSIPAHLRTDMARHVNSEHINDMEEQTAADAGIARALLMQGGEADGGVTDVVFINFDYIFLSIYYHDADSPVPSLAMQFHLETEADDPIIDSRGTVQFGDPNAPLRFHMPFVERRMLAMHAHGYMPDRVSLVAHTRSVGDHPIELARTEPFSVLDEAGGVRPEPFSVEAGGSQFEFSQILNPYTARFIQWVIPCSTFVRLVLPRPVVIEIE
jgi:hypothetical protein